MSERAKHVAPAKANVKVRDPQDGEHLPPEGRIVEVNLSYWKRRERDGDVTIGPAAKGREIIRSARAKAAEDAKASKSAKAAKKEG